MFARHLRRLPRIARNETSNVFNKQQQKYHDGLTENDKAALKLLRHVATATVVASGAVHLHDRFSDDTYSTNCKLWKAFNKAKVGHDTCYTTVSTFRNCMEVNDDDYTKCESKLNNCPTPEER